MSNGTGSQLFTIRIWAEEINETESELRGKVLHVTSGETQYFRDWSRLLAFIQDMMCRSSAIQGASTAVEEDDALLTGAPPMTKSQEQEG